MNWTAPKYILFCFSRNEVEISLIGFEGLNSEMNVVLYIYNIKILKGENYDL